MYLNNVSMQDNTTVYLMEVWVSTPIAINGVAMGTGGGGRGSGCGSMGGGRGSGRSGTGGGCGSTGGLTAEKKYMHIHVIIIIT